MAVQERIRIQRVYEQDASASGVRFLVDGLWPRGVRKADLALDGWLKEVAPSAELRRWFGHDPARWAEFQQRYQQELDAKPEAWAPILEAAREGPVTLLYAAHDPALNNALVLKRYLDSHASTKPAAKRSRSSASKKRGT